jgi:prepilin-type N-terminal cleavage/methylation domain-containing protein
MMIQTKEPAARSNRPLRRAFSMLEVLIVVVVLGILAGIVVPNVTQASATARAASAQNSLATYRAGIAAFRSSAVLAGTAPYPTLAQLTTPDLVVAGSDLPANPLNDSRVVQAATQAQAASRAVFGSAGWNYYVDNAANPPVAILYMNSSEQVVDTAGVSRAASSL